MAWEGVYARRAGKVLAGDGKGVVGGIRLSGVVGRGDELCVAVLCGAVLCCAADVGGSGGRSALGCSG